MNTNLLKALLVVVALPTLGMVHDDNSKIAPQSMGMEHLIDLFMVGGRPHNGDASRQVTVLVNHGYVVGYSEDRRNPLWSAYRASEVKGDADPIRFERARFFYADNRTASAVGGQTYGDDFDRGHMTPNSAIASQYGPLAQLETFFMTNICPQKDDLNQGPWRRLELHVVAAAQEKDHVFVISGPIFGDDPEIVALGPERDIQIPDAFYMILVDASFEFQFVPTIDLVAYRFPQDTAADADISDRLLFGVSVNQIEEATGLDFFPLFDELMTDWETREGEVADEHWDLDD